jgi:peptidoglycan/xylan/chitin deacetylase (PgdA/CDA1 family)
MLDGLLFTKTPSLLTSVYKQCLWKVDTNEKILYLTFDDGPLPEVTPFVLAELKKWNAKGTFFCIGKNVDANPTLFQQIIAEGHSTGNHTYNHMNGWNFDNKTYYTNIEKCNSTLLQQSAIRNPQSAMLFRPPYGKLTPSQYRHLKNRFKIVMWDVLSYDFDLQIAKEKVLANVLDNADKGSIVVFHDSLKAKPKMEYALPKVLEHFTAKGFKFDRL